MTRLDALKALAAKVDAGDGEWNRIASALQFDAGWSVTDAQNAATAYTGSLDAAKHLHDSVLPGRNWHVTSSGAVIIDMPDWTTVVKHKEGHEPARAWLFAILRALIAQEEAVHPLQALQDAGQAWDAG